MCEEVKCLEISNISYKRMKADRNSYRKKYKISICICAFILILMTYFGAISISLYNIRSSNDDLIEELQNKVSELEIENHEYEIQLTEKEGTISSLKDINDYTNLKVTGMQKNINDLNDYINLNVIKLEATPHLDLSTNTEMDTDTMNKIIDHFAETNNTRFKGHGQTFIEASKQTGLNPVFILSLACLESGFGTSDISLNKNNFMGIGAYDHSPYDSSYHLGDDIDTGIINGAKWIKENYYDKGQTTLYSMIYGEKEYSTSKNHWINSICSLMNTSYKVAATK